MIEIAYNFGYFLNPWKIIKTLENNLNIALTAQVA